MGIIRIKQTKFRAQEKFGRVKTKESGKILFDWSKGTLDRSINTLLETISSKIPFDRLKGTLNRSTGTPAGKSHIFSFEKLTLVERFGYELRHPKLDFTVENQCVKVLGALQKCRDTSHTQQSHLVLYMSILVVFWCG